MALPQPTAGTVQLSFSLPNSTPDLAMNVQLHLKSIR